MKTKVSLTNSSTIGSLQDSVDLRDWILPSEQSFLFNEIVADNDITIVSTDLANGVTFFMSSTPKSTSVSRANKRLRGEIVDQTVSTE